jgi:four-jointed box protein 1
MNVHDIWNITLNDATSSSSLSTSHILIDRLKAKYSGSSSSNSVDNDPQMRRKKLMQKKKIVISERMYDKFIELAQWSDLIIFDYLIANLDRVVNNLYNYQWNADIMAAPAHNLARQINSQLLVFLDNESGLLHGYRLLKKYEAYHSLLLDDLCVFRKSTIDALRDLRDANAGERLNELFERTATSKVRDVLPPLPEKSIKILSDRIDHVLLQVQKCQDMYSNR